MQADLKYQKYQPKTQTNYDPARDCKRDAAATVMQDLAAISSKPIVNYYRSNRPVVDGQLLKAGVRLANILNEVFR
jgi:hypothetical protein